MNQTSAKLPTTKRAIRTLEAGDHLSSHEFMARYHATPSVNKAELIEGRVDMPSPVSSKGHGTPHAKLMAWLGAYWFATPGVEVVDNGTLTLDHDNVFQPDAILRIPSERGGRSRIENEYLFGAPELVVEVSSSTESKDLNEKFRVYRRAGVAEYLVWRVRDNQFDWFTFGNEDHDRIEPVDGIYKSKVFPGLWLNADAILSGNLQLVLQTLTLGCQSDEHKAFLGRLA